MPPYTGTIAVFSSASLLLICFCHFSFFLSLSFSLSLFFFFFFFLGVGLVVVKIWYPWFKQDRKHSVTFSFQHMSHRLFAFEKSSHLSWMQYLLLVSVCLLFFLYVFFLSYFVYGLSVFLFYLFLFVSLFILSSACAVNLWHSSYRLPFSHSGEAEQHGRQGVHEAHKSHRGRHRLRGERAAFTETHSAVALCRLFGLQQFVRYCAHPQQCSGRHGTSDPRLPESGCVSGRDGFYFTCVRIWGMVQWITLCLHFFFLLEIRSHAPVALFWPGSASWGNCG